MTDPALHEPRDHDERFSIDADPDEAMRTLLNAPQTPPYQAVEADDTHTGPVISPDAVEDLQSRHAGEWVAVENGQEVVASGSTFARTYAAAENAGIKHPHVRFVETETPRYRA